MQLESLRLARNGKYTNNPGKLEGEITFENPKGKVQIILDDETCHKVLMLCAEGLVATAQTVAKDLTAEIINSATKVLAAPHE